MPFYKLHDHIFWDPTSPGHMSIQKHLIIKEQTHGGFFHTKRSLFGAWKRLFMNKPTTLEDIIGLEYTKLGFFGEVKKNMAKLQATNRQLERKQRKLEAIFDGISDVMVIISSNFTIISVNELFSTFFKHANPKGNFCYEILKKRDCPCVDCPISKSRATNKVCRKMMTFDIENKHYQFDVTVSPLRDAQKKAFRFLVLMRGCHPGKGVPIQVQLF